MSLSLSASCKAEMGSSCTYRGDDGSSSGIGGDGGNLGVSRMRPLTSIIIAAKHSSASVSNLFAAPLHGSVSCSWRDGGFEGIGACSCAWAYVLRNAHLLGSWRIQSSLRRPALGRISSADMLSSIIGEYCSIENRCREPSCWPLARLALQSAVSARAHNLLTNRGSPELSA